MPTRARPQSHSLTHIAGALDGISSHDGAHPPRSRSGVPPIVLPPPSRSPVFEACAFRLPGQAPRCVPQFLSGKLQCP